jgi:hypothetical protein
MEILANSIGMLGVAIQLVAYWLLASGKMSHNDARYPVINIIGTLCIVMSVLYQWNLPSFVSQVMWIAISIAGLIRIKMGRRV